MSFPLILLFDTFKRTRVDAWCVRVSSVLHQRRCLHTSRSYMTVLLLRPRNAKRLANVDKVNHSLPCCLHDRFSPSPPPPPPPFPSFHPRITAGCASVFIVVNIFMKVCRFVACEIHCAKDFLQFRVWRNLDAESQTTFDDVR